jgi:hypothetical protein
MSEDGGQRTEDRVKNPDPKNQVFNDQVRGFAPIGILESWNNGIMGPGKLRYCVNGKIRFDDIIKIG